MRKFLFLSMVLMLTGIVSWAQRTITGRVTDANGNPVPNASVVIQNTQTGTVTRDDGTFSLAIPENARTLVITAVGLAPQEISIGSQTNFTVSMRSAQEQNMQEVVVVGYGTQRRRDVTGSVSQISGAKIKDMPVQSFEQALSGRAAGVNISIPNGVLGNPPVIRVRGVNSISLSSFPLVVIDGVPTFTGDVGGTAANNVLGDLNPNDIESMEILKDASAAAIYGSRAAAGVLLITTKKGRQGRTRVNYEGWASWTKAYNLIEVLNAQEFTDLKNEGLVNAGTPANGTTRGFYTMTDANGKLVDTRWYDHVYRTGFSHNHNINFSGANERTSYYFSAGYSKQEGMIINNEFERMTGRFTMDHRVNDWLSAGGTFNFTTTNNLGINTGSIPGSAFNTSGAGRLPIALAPNVGPYRNDGSYNINFASNQIGQGNNLSALAFTNPVALLDLNKFTSRTDRLIGNAYATFRLVRGLSFKTLYGVDNLLVENNEFQTGLHGDGVQFSGQAQNTSQRLKRWNWQNVLNYDAKFGDNHNFSVLFGHEEQNTENAGFGAARRQVGDSVFNTYQGPYASIVPAGNFLGENYLLSFFTRINYDYKKKYFLSLNARRDGYSAFAAGKKWGNFAGASIGWAVSEEDFWKNSSINNTISSLRLRGSYGEVGNNVGIGNYQSFTLYSGGLYGDAFTLFLSQVGNSNLTWETSKKLDIGANFGFLGDRFTFEFAYYKNDIDGLILPDPQAPSRGIPGNSILVNVGSMRNSGFEFTLNGTVLNKKDFSWNANFNITTQKNIVTALNADGSDIQVATSGLERPSIIRVGESIGSFYVVKTEGINPQNGQRIFVLNDGTRIQYNHAAAAASRWTRVDNGAVSRGADQSVDGVIMGPALPKYFGGFDNTFRWKGLDLNVLIYFSGGNYVYNGTKAGLHDNRNWNSAKDALNRWTKAGDNAMWPRMVFGDNISNGSGIVISNNVEKGDFIKGRSITLGYTLPKSITDRLTFTSARFYLSVLNAFTITDYTGFDPEIQSNGNANGGLSVDRNSVPMARTFNVGLNIGL